jgi:class 3 adenylate cyclase
MATKMLLPNIKLLVIKGNDIGKAYETNRFPVIIGRDKTADFVLENDNNISRKHAMIDSNGSKIWIKDLNSTNGSYADNIRISKKSEISDGTEIILGNTWIELITSRKKDNRQAEKADDCSTFISCMKQKEAIFVLDIHESSRIADECGDDAVMKINKAVKKIAITAANQFKASYIKGTGDGFLITYEKPENALKTAVNIIKKLDKHNVRKTGNDRINIRIGINYGETSIEPDGDRIGHEVNVAFRIEGLKYTNIKKTRTSIAKNEFPQFNRILVSEKFFKEVGDMNQTFKFIGGFNLKGIRQIHKVYQVIV